MKNYFLVVLLSLTPLLAMGQNANEHTVVNGETLQSIASKYGLSISDIRAANSGLDDYVFVGMVLKIPSKQVVIPQQTDGKGEGLDDIIYLKDGSELVANILSIDTSTVTFEQYDTDDPFSISKTDISSIKHKDGSVTDFSVQTKPKTPKTTTTKKRRKR